MEQCDVPLGTPGELGLMVCLISAHMAPQPPPRPHEGHLGAIQRLQEGFEDDGRPPEGHPDPLPAGPRGVGNLMTGDYLMTGRGIGPGGAPRAPWILVAIRSG